MSDKGREIAQSTNQNELMIFSFTFPAKPTDATDVINSLARQLGALGFGTRFLVVQNDGSWELT